MLNKLIQIIDPIKNKILNLGLIFIGIKIKHRVINTKIIFSVASV